MLALLFWILAVVVTMTLTESCSSKKQMEQVLYDQKWVPLIEPLNSLKYLT